MRLYEVAHQIEHLLFSVDVNPEDRHFLLYYIGQGFDQNTGEYRSKTLELETALQCRDCPHRENNCPEDCKILILRCKEHIL